MIKGLLEKLMPWKKKVGPSYLRAKAMMLGAGAGPSLKGDDDGKVRVSVEKK